MHTLLPSFAFVLFMLGNVVAASAQGNSVLPAVPTPTDVKPGSITCEDVSHIIGSLRRMSSWPQVMHFDMCPYLQSALHNCRERR